MLPFHLKHIIDEIPRVKEILSKLLAGLLKSFKEIKGYKDIFQIMVQILSLVDIEIRYQNHYFLFFW